MAFSSALLIDCITMGTFELFWGLEMLFYFGEAGKQWLETRGANSNLLYFILTRALFETCLSAKGIKSC